MEENEIRYSFKRVVSVSSLSKRANSNIYVNTSRDFFLELYTPTTTTTMNGVIQTGFFFIRLSLALVNKKKP